MTDPVVTLPPHGLSPSQLDTWNSCQQKWYAKYVLKVDDPPGDAATTGTMAHAVLEAVTKLEPGQRTPAAATAAARELWADRPVELRRAAWPHVARILRNQEVALGKVIGREVPVNATIGGVPFRGQIDRIDQLPSGLAGIRDYKTGKHPGRRDWLAEKQLQVVLYGVAWETAAEHEVNDVALIWTGPGRVDSWELTDPLRAKATKALRVAWSQLETAVERSKKGDPPADVFEPKPGGLCSWCPALHLCPTGQDAVRLRAKDRTKPIGPQGVKLLEAEIVGQMEATLAAQTGDHLTVVPTPVDPPRPRAATQQLSRVRRHRPLG